MKYQSSLLPLSYQLLLFFRRCGLNSLCFPLLQLINKGEANKPEFEAFKGSGKTLRQKRKNQRRKKEIIHFYRVFICTQSGPIFGRRNLSVVLVEAKQNGTRACGENFSRYLWCADNYRMDNVFSSTFDSRMIGTIPILDCKPVGIVLAQRQSYTLE